MPGCRALGSVAAGSSMVSHTLVAASLLPPGHCQPTALAPSTALPTLLHLSSCPMQCNGKREATYGENADDANGGKEPEK